MELRLTPSWIRVLIGLNTNLAATAVALIILTPNFIPLTDTGRIWVLLFNIMAVILFVVAAVRLDELLHKQYE